MRWNNRTKPNVGDTRWAYKFFFFPANFYGQWIWMEWGHVFQEYVESYIYEMGFAIPNHRWEDQGIANI